VVRAPCVNQLRATRRTEHLFDAFRVGLERSEYVGRAQRLDEQLAGAAPDTLVVVHQVFDDAGSIDRETKRRRVEWRRPAGTGTAGPRRWLSSFSDRWAWRRCGEG
jgi:hypothetical protein